MALCQALPDVLELLDLSLRGPGDEHPGRERGREHRDRQDEQAITTVGDTGSEEQGQRHDQEQAKVETGPHSVTAPGKYHNFGPIAGGEPAM